MIETFFDITATNTRKTTASPTGSDTVATISSFAGVIRPVDDVSKLYIENNIGKEFDLVADDTVNVAVGDKIYVAGVSYDVLGVTLYNDLENGEDSYKNIRIVK